MHMSMGENDSLSGCTINMLAIMKIPRSHLMGYNHTSKQLRLHRLNDRLIYSVPSKVEVEYKDRFVWQCIQAKICIRYIFRIYVLWVKQMVAHSENYSWSLGRRSIPAWVVCYRPHIIIYGSLGVWSVALPHIVFQLHFARDQIRATMTAFAPKITDHVSHELRPWGHYCILCITWLCDFILHNMHVLASR